MPLLNFQSRFAPLVESGEKRQTIRAYRKDGRDPKVGDRLYLYQGARTRQCRKLGEASCVRVLPIELTVRGPRGNVNLTVGFPQIRAGDLRFRIGCLRGSAGDPYCAEFAAIARADGFESADAMADWFETTHGLPFRGLLIEWAEIERGE